MLLEGLDTSLYSELKQGSKGDAAKALRQKLVDLYWLDAKADGKYGKTTKAAIEKFQAAVDLEATGVADAATQAILFSDKAPEHKLSISCSSIVIGSSAQTTWSVDGEQFTLKGKKTKKIKTVWGTYVFDAYGQYQKLEA